MNDMDMLVEVRDDGYIMLLKPTRWMYIDGETRPIEGIDANGVIHTIAQPHVAWLSRTA